MIECSRDNECPGNTICLDDGSQGHHCGCRAPFVQDGEYCICKFIFNCIILFHYVNIQCVHC